MCLSINVPVQQMLVFCALRLPCPCKCYGTKQKNPEVSVEKNVRILPQAKGRILHHEEDCTQKMKTKLTTKNGKPKFISMAEAVRQFQINTPDRFHSKPKTDCEETQAICDSVKCESADDLTASGTVCASVQSEHKESLDVASKSVY